MRYALTIMAILLSFGIVLTSCRSDEDAGKTRPSRGTKRSPEEDLRRLQALFKAYGGQLTTGDDTQVVWKDTIAFRVFEFAHHTVVVWPYDWQDDAFEVKVIAGHLPTSGDLFEAVRYDYDSAQERYVNPHIKFSLDQPEIGEVSFLGFFLGQPREDVIDIHARNIRKAWPNHPEQREIRMATLTGPTDEYNASSGDIGEVMLTFHYEKGKLAHMTFRSRGTGPLGALSISHQTMPALTQGTLELPREQDEGGMNKSGQ